MFSKYQQADKNLRQQQQWHEQQQECYYTTWNKMTSDCEVGGEKENTQKY